MIKQTQTRQKSFSEGYTVINQFPKYDELLINEIEEPVPKLEDINRNNIYNHIYDKIIGFLFHLVLISVFELLFFNYYIIQYENNALISLSDSLIGPITNTCQTLSPFSKTLIDDVINIFINETTVNDNAENDFNNRQIVNQKIYQKSIIYCLGVISLFLFTLSLNIVFRQKINFVTIILDNLVMIMILGIYEYIFFKNIVFGYLIMGPNELLKNIMDTLLYKC